MDYLLFGDFYNINVENEKTKWRSMDIGKVIVSVRHFRHSGGKVQMVL